MRSATGSSANCRASRSLMGLLAVDVTGFGVVMSADSRRVEIEGGQNRVLPPRAARRERRNPITVSWAGGFTGLIGFAGTGD